MPGRPDFTDRKIHVLENPTVRYKEGEFETYAKALRQAIKRGEISHQAGWLWLTISELAGDDREAYSGQEYLANELNTSVPSIKRWTKELEETGWLVKQNRTATSNKYWTAIPAEANALHQDYTPRLTTVGQELSTRKRSTRAKSTPAETHKLTGDPMENEPMDSVHKLMDEPMHKLTGDPIDKLTSDPLTRQSIKETEHNHTELASYQRVTKCLEDNQRSPLVETKSPLVIPGEVPMEEIGISPLVDDSRVSDAPVSPSGETKKSRASFVVKKSAAPSKKTGTSHVPAPSLGATRPYQGAPQLSRTEQHHLNIRLQGQQNIKAARLKEEETARRKAEFAAYVSAETMEGV
ncbi:hypothetical protein C6376_13970 [Streptomyces sp. P3]|uniref:helix-turn-helix domain-containing protein n=1 Tax=Streptomyces sp. P3 TaxID=2135430 RepID=UPI000D199E83|nr:helix-turn-helix domain-containing protein [Streptomyces sp. P3]AVV42368.1 hypothetical protein C6376_13970 [Streptomyces sp. P3]